MLPPPLDNEITQAALLVVGAVALGVAVAWWWRGRSLRGNGEADGKRPNPESCIPSAKTTDSGDVSDAHPVTPLEAPSPPTEVNPVPPEQIATPSDRLSGIASKVESADLKEFLGDIASVVEASGPNFSSETPDGFVEEMVDRIDDLRTLRANRIGKDAAALDEFGQVVAAILVACGVEMIHSSNWDPALQRAIAKQPIDGTQVPCITSFGSTGIIRHGQLRRKQEVVLAVPPSS